MAHGFLTPTEVSGDRFWENVKDIGKLFKRLSKLFKKDLRVINTNVKEVRELITGKDQGSLPGSSNKALPPGSGGLAKRGGTFSSLANISPVNGGGGLNSDAFFKQAQTGVGPSGEYLTKSQRREAFIKSRQEAVKTSSAVRQAPNITPDGNSDVVSAVNRNTEAISTLIKVTEKQTSTQVQLSTKSDQKAEKMLSRSRARAEEKDIEKGKDLSGFLTPIKAAAEKEKKQGGGGDGGDGLFDFLDLGLDVLDLFDGGGKKRRGRRGKPRAGGRNRMPRKPSSPRRGLPKPKLPKFGGGLKGKLPGLPKGVGPKGGLLSLLFAGMEFSGRKSSGQSNLQAGVGTAASVAGGLAGAKGGAAAGAAIGALFGGVGAVPGAIIGGLLGGLGGSMLAGGAADMATGAFSNGGIISKPILSLMGEGSKAEGVFPLEGTKGKKTFEMFGKGILEAQKSKKDEFAKIQAAGLKFYFQNQEGFKFFGDVLKTLFAPLLAPLEVLKNVGGGLLNALMGGANAMTLNQAGDYLNVGGGTGEQNLAAFLSTMEASGNQNQADAFQVMLNRAADAQAGGSMKAYGTTLGDQITAREQFSPISSAIYGVSADSAAAAKYGPISRALGSNPAERKKKLLQIASQPDGLVALQKLFGGGSASDAAKVLQDFKSGGALSQRSAADIGSMVSFRGYRSGAGDFNRGAGGNFFFGQGSKGKVGSLSQVSPGGSLGGGGNASIAAAAQSLRGMDTSGGPGGGSVSCVYAVNKVFNKAGVKPPWGGAQSTDAVINASKSAGWQQVGFKDARPGDVWVYDANDGRTGHVGIMMPNGRVLSNSSSQAKFIWEADRAELLQRYPKNGMTPPGGTFFRAPGSGNIASPPGTGATPSTATAPDGQYNIPGAPQLSSALNAANPNTGTSMMATSAQVAMAGITQSGAAPTIINNNYYGMGGQQGQVNPNGVSTGIGMGDTGTSIFQDLRIRSLG